MTKQSLRKFLFIPLMRPLSAEDSEQHVVHVTAWTNKQVDRDVYSTGVCKLNLWVMGVIMWVLKAGQWEQISCDLSMLRGIRLTAALFTLYFTNLTHSLYPNVTPYQNQTATLKQTPYFNPFGAE